MRETEKEFAIEIASIGRVTNIIHLSIKPSNYQTIKAAAQITKLKWRPFLHQKLGSGPRRERQPASKGKARKKMEDREPGKILEMSLRLVVESKSFKPRI